MGFSALLLALLDPCLARERWLLQNDISVVVMETARVELSATVTIELNPLGYAVGKTSRLTQPGGQSRALGAIIGEMYLCGAPKQ